MSMPKPRFGHHNTDINVYLRDEKYYSELKSYLSNAQNEGAITGFIGGPPCPDFSVGGKNKGRDGDNGKLSSSYVELITEMKPDFFLFENVKGLWRTARHREFFEELKDQLHSAGYCTTERLTNALEFGVAQDRDRILLVGVKKSILKHKYYKGTDLLNFPWEIRIKYNLAGIKGLKWPETDEFNTNIFTKCPNEDEIVKALTVQYWFERNSVETHPNSNAFFQPKAGLVKMQTIPEGDVSKKSYKRLHRWRYSPTAAYGNNEVHLHPYKARRLSAAEALAIQSLPKEFELPAEMTLSDMFKTIGNGVPYLLSKSIAETIQIYLEEAICKE